MNVGPVVSIGMPVYNGERFLSQALDSLLQQTYTDFEIIIVDNASTDATQAICQTYAAKDSRIGYHRNPANIGAARNFNLAFERARGRYFKWAAHDDLVAPSFLEKAVHVLDEQSKVVLCHSLTCVIDETGAVHEEDIIDINADSLNPSMRFRKAMFGARCYEIFGLIRCDALRSTGLIGAYARGDGVLLARLALLGQFRLITERLFFARRHAEQSMAMVSDYHAYARWFDQVSGGRRFIFPTWRICIEYVRSLNNVQLTPMQRGACLVSVLRWAATRRRRLLRDVRVAVEMICFGASQPIRRRLFRMDGIYRTIRRTVELTGPHPK